MGPGGFALKKLLRQVIASPNFENALEKLDIPPERMINPLLCFLYETDETIRWRAVRGIAITVSAMAEKDLESSRIIMRRLIWSLNDESGGIGWGAPEAMGEIMAENEALAGEYHRILVSYIDENGNLLDNDELERGVMWAIERLARKRPKLLRDWTGPVLAQLSSPDPMKRGLALRVLLALVDEHRLGIDTERPGPLIVPLLEDRNKIRVFQDGLFVDYEVGTLASELLYRLNIHSETARNQC